jgi:hypothetical protein
MKRLFNFFMFLVFLLPAVVPLHAQFLGGNGDGVASRKHTATLNVQSDYCSGGNGNGYGLAAFGPVSIVDQSLYCNGGYGNGYDDGAFTGTMFSSAHYCSGGIGNGFSSAVFGPFALFEQSVYCSGGNGNGYDRSGFTGTMFSSAAYCSGGIGDGSSSAGFGPIALTDQSVYCSGGNGNGYDDGAFTGTMFSSEPYCSGGNGNGYGLAGTSLNLGTGIWKGIVSTDWNLPLNWTNNQVPGVTDDVVVPPACPYYPVLPGGLLAIGGNTGAFLCASMHIDEGAQVSSNGETEIAGPFSVAGQYVVTNNTVNSQVILNTGELTIEPYGVVRLGNQSEGPAICDLRVSSGGQLTVNGGALEIDDQLILQAGATFNMTGGSVFVHRFGEGSQPGPLNPGAFYVQSGAAGGISGGLLKVCGKNPNPLYASVSINEPTFGFTGSGTLMFTPGISSNAYDADLQTVPGATINNLLISKPGNTVTVRNDAVVSGILMIYNGSTLNVPAGITVTAEKDVFLLP